MYSPLQPVQCIRFLSRIGALEGPSEAETMFVHVDRFPTRRYLVSITAVTFTVNFVSYLPYGSFTSIMSHVSCYGSP
jgi:hypothetical protein